MKALKKLLGIDEIEQAVCTLGQAVLQPTTAVERCTQVTLLHLKALGFEVTFLTPEEAEKLKKAEQTLSTKGMN